LLVGDAVSMKPTLDHAGVPAGEFSVSPPLPAGLALHPQTGEISGTPAIATARQNYTVTQENVAGKAECTISLEVQQHDTPGEMKHGAPDQQVYKIFVVYEKIEIVPTQVDNHLVFSITPGLPQGLALDPKTGAITGTLSAVMEKTTWTLTARNKRGEESSKVVFAVTDDWRTACDHPQKWTRDMVRMWMTSSDALDLHDDADLLPFLDVDGAELVRLDTPQALEARCPSLSKMQKQFISQGIEKLKQNAAIAAPSPGGVEDEREAAGLAKREVRGCCFGPSALPPSSGGLG
jgi:hypothetical protein